MYPEYERIFIISQHFCRGVVKARQIQNLNLWQKAPRIGTKGFTACNLTLPLMLFQVDMEIVFQRNPFFQKQVSLLFPAGNQPSAMIDNPMAGIVTVILRPAQTCPTRRAFLLRPISLAIWP